MARNVVLVRNIHKVPLNLWLQRKLLRPVRIELEGVRVEMRGDVAAAAWVGVHPPGAADVVRLLVDLIGGVRVVLL